MIVPVDFSERFVAVHTLLPLIPLVDDGPYQAGLRSFLDLRQAFFPAATRTAAGLCVSGHETSLFPRNFRYVRRARRNSTITATAAATKNVIRTYFIGRSFLAPPPGRPGPMPELAPFQRPKRIRFTSETSFTELDPGGFSLAAFHVLTTTSPATNLAVTGLTLLRDAGHSPARKRALEQWKTARNGCSSGPFSLLAASCGDLLHKRCRRLDFNLARQGSRGNRRRDLQHAVHILRGQLLAVQALWQLESPLEHAIDDLPFNELDLFRAVGELPFPANDEHIRLCMDLQVLRLHSRQCHAANILLGFFVHVRFHRWSNVEGLLELRQLKTPGLAAQNAIEHLVELTTKTKQILEQPFIGIQISHDILLN